MHSHTRPVDRFFVVLLEEIEKGAAGNLEEPFTVAEIYQSLIPYRTHRDRLGVEMNGDYEDTLLRLLSGEGDFLLLESDTARNRIRHELAKSNPNTGIYREFAAVGVRLNPDRAPSGNTSERKADAPKGQSLQTSLEAMEPTGEVIADGKAGPPAPSETVASPRSRRKVSPPSPAAGSGASVDEPCPDCGEALPKRDTLKFCPHCGTNVRSAPCSQCGEVLERRWRFCVACGTPTG